MLEGVVNQFKTLPTWQKYLLLLVVPLLLSVYLWTSMILPLKEEIAQLENKRREEEEIVRKLKPSVTGEKEDTLESLRKQEEELKQKLVLKEQELSKLVGEVLTEKEMGKLVSTLSSLARRSGITIVSVKFSSPQETAYILENVSNGRIVKELFAQTPSQQTPTQQNIQQVQVEPQQLTGARFYKVETSITLMGKFVGIRKFLENLSNLSFVSYPVSISIKKGEGDSLQADLVLIINLKKEGA